MKQTRFCMSHRLGLIYGSAIVCLASPEKAIKVAADSLLFTSGMRIGYTGRKTGADDAGEFQRHPSSPFVLLFYGFPCGRNKWWSK